MGSRRLLEVGVDFLDEYGFGLKSRRLVSGDWGFAWKNIAMRWYHVEEDLCCITSDTGEEFTNGPNRGKTCLNVGDAESRQTSDS